MEAYHQYLKGRFYLNKFTEDGVGKSICCFRQAIERAPKYALALAGLADAYVQLGSDRVAGMRPSEAIPLARAAAEKALEIDESLLEAHVSLAMISQWHDRDWEGAERHWRKVLDLGHTYVFGRIWHAMHLVCRRKFEEAIQEVRLARDSDPLSVVANVYVGVVLMLAHRVDEAVQELRGAVEMDPGFYRAHFFLGIALRQQRMYPEALEELREARRLAADTPEVLALTAHCNAVAGFREEALSLLRLLQEASSRRYVPPGFFAEVYAGLNDPDHAFEWLEKAIDGHCTVVSLLAVEPVFEELRSDPRFSLYVRRIGLEGDD